MSGCEVAQNETIAHFLAEKFDAEYDNLSYTGCSNDRIYDSTMDYLRDNTPNLIVIGWTEPHRIQWFDPDIGELIEMNSKLITYTPYTEAQRARAELCRDLMDIEGDYGKQQTLYWHNKIYNMHQMLKYKNIPHLFFSAIDNFEYLRFVDTYCHDWGANYYKPYWSSYRTWGVETNQTQVTPGWFHYDAAGQRAWADILYNHMVKNDIIR